MNDITQIYFAGGVEMKEIYIQEGADILDVDTRTFDRFVKNKLLKVVRTTPSGWRTFSKEQVLALKKRLPGKRKKGIDYLYQLKKKV